MVGAGLAVAWCLLGAFLMGRSGRALQRRRWLTAMASPRSLLLASWLSYRALFTWFNPLGYVSSRIVMPIALTLVFGSVGRYAQGSAAGAVVGGMMIGVAFASVYGITLSIANERQFGTMGVWLATPQRLGTSIAVKALPHLVDGQIARCSPSVSHAPPSIGWRRAGLQRCCCARLSRDWPPPVRHRDRGLLGALRGRLHRPQPR